MTFRFELQQRVAITESDEQGAVIGRADYACAENQFLIRYQAADGRAVEAWWADSALEAVKTEG